LFSFASFSPLAPSTIPRSGNFDVIVLVFTLVTYYDTATSPWLASFARGVVAAVNVKLVENALKVRELGKIISPGSHTCLH
jgi:hypothetical protein